MRIPPTLLRLHSTIAVWKGLGVRLTSPVCSPRIKSRCTYLLRWDGNATACRPGLDPRTPIDAVVVQIARVALLLPATPYYLPPTTLTGSAQVHQDPRPAPERPTPLESRRRPLSKHQGMSLRILNSRIPPCFLFSHLEPASAADVLCFMSESIARAAHAQATRVAGLTSCPIRTRLLHVPWSMPRHLKSAACLQEMFNSDTMFGHCLLFRMHCSCVHCLQRILSPFEGIPNSDTSRLD